MAGEILKKRREELGCDIHEVADLLKIKSDYLTDIESDSFPKLPAPVYTMGYIRAYAKYLGVDADPIIKHYAVNLSQPGYTTIVPIAFSQKKSPKIIFFIPLLLVAAAVYYFVSPILDARFTWPFETNNPEKKVVVAAIHPHPAVARPLESNQDHNIVPDGVEHNLNISASDTTWISVRFGDGKTEEMLLSPGNSKSLQFSEKATLKIGNAGGIRLNLDGKDMGMPGIRGQVVTMSFPDH